MLADTVKRILLCFCREHTFLHIFFYKFKHHPQTETNTGSRKYDVGKEVTATDVNGDITAPIMYLFNVNFKLHEAVLINLFGLFGLKF